MPNLYKSFYLQDIINKINEVALCSQLECYMDEKAAYANVCTAMYNEGIHDLAKDLVQEFTREATESE